MKVTGEFGQSVAGKFSNLYRKDSVTSLFDFYFKHRKLDIFPEKTHIIFSQETLDLDCASVSNRAQGQDMILNRPFHNVVLVQGVSCSSLTLVFRHRNFVMILFSEYCLGLQDC